ncbi:MAG TPA: hypothetical protein VF145_11180 [Chitinophagaceae bacterium]
MKPVLNYVRTIFALMVLTVVQMSTYGQTTGGEGSTSTTEVEITADTGNWFTNNWIWVVGVIVFIILLFALIGSGGSSRRTTVIREDAGTGRVTRTTTVDDDV